MTPARAVVSTHTFAQHTLVRVRVHVHRHTHTGREGRGYREKGKNFQGVLAVKAKH